MTTRPERVSPADGDGQIRWMAHSRDPQEARLLAALLDAARRVNALAQDRKPANPLVDRCKKRLQRADAEAAGSRYVAWDCLHQLDDKILVGLKAHKRRTRWFSLQAEAKTKLKGIWRGDAVDAVAKQVPEGQEASLHIVREVHAHLATVAQNQQHKLELFEKRSLPWLSTLLALAALGALGFAYWSTSIYRTSDSAEWASALATGVPAGALGGILSMAFALGRADLKGKIPDMRLSGLVTITRPLLGAVVAIPVSAQVQAGVP